MTVTWRRGMLRDSGDAGSLLVLKLGGSLLTRDGWASEVTSLVGSLPAPRLIVTGGGPAVDGLRAIDRAEPLPASLVHRLAIDCMGLTARLVATALNLPLVMDTAANGPPAAVLAAPAWLDRESRLARLPVGWQVTSDSIAALVAAELGTGLVLVKRVPPPDDDIERLAAAGWVDAFFPTACRSVPWIGWAAPA